MPDLFSAGQSPLQFFQQRNLRGFDFSFRVWNCEPPGSIHLGKLLLDSGARRPFEREGVTPKLCGIAIASECPRMYSFATSLRDGRQLEKGRNRFKIGFLLEFTLGRGQEGFAWFNFALGNAPGAVVLVLEKRPARMDEQHLQLAVANPIRQQTGT